MPQPMSCEHTVSMAVAFFTLAACQSLYSFSCINELQERKWTLTLCGFVLATGELGLLLVLCLSVRSVQVFGTRLLMHYGILAVGVSFIALAYASEVWFIILSFFLRALAGVGKTVSYLASFVFLLASTPRKTAILSLISSSALGMVCGSLFGAIDSQTDGFDLNFVLVGLTVIWISFVVPTNLPLDQDMHLIVSAEDTLKPLSAVYISGVRKYPALLGCTVVLISSLCFSLMTLALGPILQSEVAFNSYDVGFAFLLMYVSALAGAVASSFLSFKEAPVAFVTLTGLICMLAGLLLLGPAKLINLPSGKYVYLMGIVALSIGFSTSLVSVSVSLIEVTNKSNIQPSSNNAFGTTVCLICITFMFGSFFGSGLFGVLVDLVGFQSCVDTLVIAVLVAVALQIVQVRCGCIDDHSDGSLIEESRNNSILYGSID
ncbi:uncharacterized protein LOC132193667 isoform X2 [Neocloeon triangulifer]|uniref:uncharacterized protein LOC132193667 isoform X2 n=1 Tax=Neocloeon triangulifer TaxID=2078957 RepID=UPI00286ECF8F|nr:uncharacterized protein LOC132193667 isoform X2 [Neocloeon triangulifer]